MNKIKKNLKVVILAGGYGTRLSEYTKKIPKPMVQINRKPLLVHIINHYKKFGFKEFIIAAGYKKEVIKNYFKNKNVKVIGAWGYPVGHRVFAVVEADKFEDVAKLFEFHLAQGPVEVIPVRDALQSRRDALQSR